MELKEEKVNKVSDFVNDIWKNSIILDKNTNADQPHYVEVNKIFELVDKYKMRKTDTNETAEAMFNKIGYVKINRPKYETYKEKYVREKKIKKFPYYKVDSIVFGFKNEFLKTSSAGRDIYEEELKAIIQQLEEYKVVQ